MPRYPQGAPVRLSTTVKDVTGALVTPTTIVLTISKPDATTQAYSSPTADSTGVYHQDVPTADLSQLGHYAYKWVTTGPGAGVSFSNFDVFDPLEVSVLSLQDAKDHLNIPQTTTTYDNELLSKIATIQSTLEKLTGGPIITRSITERVTCGYGWNELAVRQRPLVGVTSITDVASGVALSLTDLDLDTNSGIIRRKLGLPFYGRSGAYSVVYTAGWGVAISPAFNEAARIILEHLWQTQHGPSLRPAIGGEETTLLPGFAFAVPNRAIELLSFAVQEAYV